MLHRELTMSWSTGRSPTLCARPRSSSKAGGATTRHARLFIYHEENGSVLHRYWTNACQNCALKQKLHHRKGATDHSMGA
jgi:hypothetical protein